MKKDKFIPLSKFPEYSPEEMIKRSNKFYEEIKNRRTVRKYSDKPIPKEVIEKCLLTAGTAPSGANRQPWHFAVVTNPEIKKKIRKAAEKEEEKFYKERAPEEWLTALEPFGTDQFKPFLETAPCLIVIFAENYEVKPDGKKATNYYVSESVGIATGMLIAAVHEAGLASLTHTPSPMKFLNEILNRPSNERPYLILVIGYPADDADVPDIRKKPLQEISTFFD